LLDRKFAVGTGGFAGADVTSLEPCALRKWACNTRN